MIDEAPKVCDKIVDRYGYLEITSVDVDRQTCVVKRHTGSNAIQRNPFIMKFDEWNGRKSKEVVQ